AEALLAELVGKRLGRVVQRVLAAVEGQLKAEQVVQWPRPGLSGVASATLCGCVVRGRIFGRCVARGRLGFHELEATTGYKVAERTSFLKQGSIRLLGLGRARIEP